MADDFDPYYQWLGISPKHQPPNHYRLLALEEFESNRDVIESAADQRMAHVRMFQSGPHGETSQWLLNEIAAAKLCLLNLAKKAEYDQKLRAEKDAAQPRRLRPLPRLEPTAAAAEGYRVASDVPPAVPSAEPGAGGRLSPHQTAMIGTVLGVLVAAAICYVVFTGDKPSDAPKSNSGNTPASAAPLAKVDNLAPAGELGKTPPVPTEKPKDSDIPRPTVAESPADKITILAAFYGQNVSWIDVTDKVQRATAGKDRWQVRVQTADWGEPAPGWPGVRSLLVHYRYQGALQFRAAFQNEVISLSDDGRKMPPLDPAKTKEPAVSGNRINVLAACYGQNVSWTDVTDKVRRATAGKDRWQVRVQTADWGEPAPGWPGVRSLLVRYAYEGGVQFRVAYQGEVILLPPPRVSHWVVEGGSEFRFSETEKGILLELVPETSKLYSKIEINLTKNGELWSGTGDLYFRNTPGQRYEARIEVLSGDIFGGPTMRTRTMCPVANMRKKLTDDTSTWVRKQP